jgi:hypothetical protein
VLGATSVEDNSIPPQSNDLPTSAPYSDIDLARWKEYDDVITETLWLLGARDKSGAHVGDYWGNFVPQIPNQILRRFTRRYEVVLDFFNGMGTTLIECRRLGRHGIGVELSAEVTKRAESRIESSENVHGVSTHIIVGDSRSTDVVDAIRTQLGTLGHAKAACVLLHPPYHDIVKFSDDPNDLSNAPSTERFLKDFGRVVANATALLADDRHLVLVIGDRYAKGACVPLGFYCTQVCLDHGLQLRAINVKDIQGNERGKGIDTNLWRYRALRHGLYVFKHEYVIVFRKPITRPGRVWRRKKRGTSNTA